MRPLAICLVLVFSGCTATGTLRGPEVTVNYDSIEDRTIIASTPSMLRNVGVGGAPAVFMQTAAICPGDVSAATVPLCPEPRYIVGFQIRGDRLTTTDATTIRIGDLRLRPEPTVSSTQAGGLTNFTEVSAYTFSKEEFEAFVTAPDGEVEARVMGITLDIPLRRRVPALMLWERVNGPLER